MQMQLDMFHKNQKNLSIIVSGAKTSDDESRYKVSLRITNIVHCIDIFAKYVDLVLMG